MPFRPSLNYTSKYLLPAACALLLPFSAAADGPAAAAATGTPIDQYQLLRYILLGFIVLFLFIILVMGNAVASAGKIYWDRESGKKMSPPGAAAIVLLLSLLAGSAHAQEGAAAAEALAKAPHMPYDLWVFIVVVALEFVIIMVLSGMLLKFLRVSTQQAMQQTNRKLFLKNILMKLNQSVPLEEEASLDLHHDYDGIRELDNRIPAWWRFAFYATILFAPVYLYRMFVSGSLKDQLEELDTANRIAAVQKAEYLKHAANNVDEHTVKMLDAAGIAEGAGLYTKNCQACHGDKGQGGVGPNLTDDYWLHKGSIKDVFHSIKYGWPEKGMKSWKDDFSPAQIAQIASFVKSLKGSNPPGGKEPQGDLFREDEAVAQAADSTKINL